jgi:hypothetical protein
MIDKEQIVLYDVSRIGEVSSRFKVDIAKHMKYCNESLGQLVAFEVEL